MAIDIYDNAEPESPDSTAKPAGPQPEAESAARPYVSILFECCNVYARVYRRPEDTVYHGRCPKCLKAVKLRVGPDGTAARFFRAE